MEKPILFNTEMVQAILADRKTVTRRVVKQDIVNRFDIDVDGSAIAYIDQSTGDSYKPTDICKYKVGDILWLRETWADHWLPDGFCTDRFVYKADGKPQLGYYGNYKQGKIDCWIPSIHMPRSAARIFLKVTNVKVERLQDITEEQAKLEGTQFFAPSYRYKMFESKWLNGMCMDCKHSDPFKLDGCKELGRKIKLLENCGCVFGFLLRGDSESLEPARLRFFGYLQHLSYKTMKYDFTYESNPWVWVIEFERVEHNG